MLFTPLTRLFPEHRVSVSGHLSSFAQASTFSAVSAGS